MCEYACSYGRKTIARRVNLFTIMKAEPAIDFLFQTEQLHLFTTVKAEHAIGFPFQTEQLQLHRARVNFHVA